MGDKYNIKQEDIDKVVLEALEELEELGYNNKSINFLYRKVGKGLYQIPYKDGVLMTNKEGVILYLKSLHPSDDEPETYTKYPRADLSITKNEENESNN